MGNKPDRDMFTHELSQAVLNGHFKSSDSRNNISSSSATYSQNPLCLSQKVEVSPDVRELSDHIDMVNDIERVSMVSDDVVVINEPKSSINMMTGSTQYDDNLDEFIELVQRIKCLEQEKEEVLSIKRLLDAEYAMSLDRCHREAADLEISMKEESQRHRESLQEHFKLEKRKNNDRLQQELMATISHLNQCVFPERLHMSEEDELARTIRQADREQQETFRQLKQHYTNKLNNGMKISSNEFQKVFDKFKKDRDDEYFSLKALKVRRSHRSVLCIQIHKISQYSYRCMRHSDVVFYLKNSQKRKSQSSVLSWLGVFPESKRTKVASESDSASDSDGDETVKMSVLG